jgi:hypothetical protein
VKIRYADMAKKLNSDVKIRYADMAKNMNSDMKIRYADMSFSGVIAEVVQQIFFFNLK